MPNAMPDGVFAQWLEAIKKAEHIHNWDMDAIVKHAAFNISFFDSEDLVRLLKVLGFRGCDVLAASGTALLQGTICMEGGGGYMMDRPTRMKYEQWLNQKVQQASVPEPELQAVSVSLVELVAKVQRETQRIFLEETIRCLGAKAYRAAIVMAWNVAYDHLLNWLLADSCRLAAFNGQLTQRQVKKGVFYDPIAVYDDFSYVKESVVIEECCKAGLIDRKNDEPHFAEGLVRWSPKTGPQAKRAKRALGRGRGAVVRFAFARFKGVNHGQEDTDAS